MANNRLGAELEEDARNMRSLTRPAAITANKKRGRRQRRIAFRNRIFGILSIVFGTAIFFGAESLYDLFDSSLMSRKEHPVWTSLDEHKLEMLSLKIDAIKAGKNVSKKVLVEAQEYLRPTPTWKDVVAASIIRVSGVIVMMFFVRLFAIHTREAERLAAAYFSTADALAMTLEAPWENFGTMAEAMNPLKGLESTVRGSSRVERL